MFKKKFWLKNGVQNCIMCCRNVGDAHDNITLWFHKTYKYYLLLILIAAGTNKIIAAFVIWDFWFILLPIYTFHKTYITLFVNVEKIIILL